MIECVARVRRKGVLAGWMKPTHLCWVDVKWFDETIASVSLVLSTGIVLDPTDCHTRNQTLCIQLKMDCLQTSPDLDLDYYYDYDYDCDYDYQYQYQYQYQYWYQHRYPLLYLLPWCHRQK